MKYVTNIGAVVLGPALVSQEVRAHLKASVPEDSRYGLRYAIGVFTDATMEADEIEDIARWMALLGVARQQGQSIAVVEDMLSRLDSGKAPAAVPTVVDIRAARSVKAKTLTRQAPLFDSKFSQQKPAAAKKKGQSKKKSPVNPPREETKQSPVKKPAVAVRKSGVILSETIKVGTRLKRIGTGETGKIANSTSSFSMVHWDDGRRFRVRTASLNNPAAYKLTGS